MIGENWGADRVVLTVSLVLAALLMPWWTKINFFPYEPPTPLTLQEEAYNSRLDAYRKCAEKIRGSLKAPATAVFMSYEDSTVTVIPADGGGFAIAVLSAVDAQNAFGANIRTKFLCGFEMTTPGHLKATGHKTL